MSVFCELNNGFVPALTTLDSLEQFEELLSFWFEGSDQPTVGEIGSRGGSPVLHVRLGTDKFALNRDTKRRAVGDFLKAAHKAGGAAELPWHVTTNINGRVNRVSYRPDDVETPGWYAYLSTPSASKRRLD